MSVEMAGQAVEILSAEKVDRVRTFGNFQETPAVSKARRSVCESSVCAGNSTVRVTAFAAWVLAGGCGRSTGARIGGRQSQRSTGSQLPTGDFLIEERDGRLPCHHRPAILAVFRSARPILPKVSDCLKPEELALSNVTAVNAVVQKPCGSTSPKNIRITSHVRSASAGQTSSRLCW